MPAISCSAPGKVILCGEHAVVYGFPAIALPVFQVSTVAKVFAKPQFPPGELRIIAPSISLDSPLSSLPDMSPLKVAVNLVMQEFHLNHLPACEILITSTLPVSAGLGSSASTTVALTRALSTYLGHPLGNEIVNRIAFEVEKLHHGSPSGIDNTVVTYETPVFYQRGSPIEFLKIARSFTLIIADTGIKSSTAEVVAGVRQRWNARQEIYDGWFSEIDRISHEIKSLLAQGDNDAMGPALTRNHELLQKIGVSCIELDHLVDISIQAGALGAKLSGSGLGGNIIALVDIEKINEVANALIDNGAVRIITSSISAVDYSGVTS